ncbi:uncharacterized protein LOC131213804 [Anopheles bellator]|uniref:uncharacterized protein LOC131213804 n=1 Tax=Anopheles bellator TaxID=139047 RepID=UPI002649980A|nr:uncharacterized protein LOC131213804 [Anopheles bellator]XP_058063919.1 uncharacterized protein LOC131213804 [Anopheles bellator]XP_058063920.1 uncharacterized protein LOC131213804 [Anopheles bellator]
MESAVPAMRNVEIKAKLGGFEAFKQLVATVEELTGSEGELIVQRDVFFNTSNGRLKLRYLTHKKSELISYDRTDVPGPKLSSYELLELDDPSCMERVLASTVGVRGRVSKRRLLFLHDQTRIHLDDVDDLGFFLELEVVLRSDQTPEEGKRIAEVIMERLQISSADLVTGAYMDHLLKK